MVRGDASPIHLSLRGVRPYMFPTDDEVEDLSPDIGWGGRTKSVSDGQSPS